MPRPNLSKNLIRQRLLGCSDCGEIKKLAEFYANKSSHNGYDNICKECRKHRVKTNYKKKTPAPQKASQVIGVKPDTPICREIGDLELHIIRERTRDGLTAWCNKLFTTLPLMFVKDMDGQLSVNRVCPTCRKSLYSAGFRLPSFSAPELRPGWT